MDSFSRVGEFHEKFGLPHSNNTAPGFPAADVLRFRAGFMLEELKEFCLAAGLAKLGMELNMVQLRLQQYPTEYPINFIGQDLELAADGLGDLKYVVDGTAHMLGLPFNAIFAEIQRANMSKERATGADDPRSKRGHALDVVKPAGWRPPNHGPIIAAAYNFKGLGG